MSKQDKIILLSTFPHHRYFWKKGISTKQWDKVFKKKYEDTESHIDISKSYPDPSRFVLDNKSMGSTGICRNFSKNSPQSKAYLNKDKNYYFLYYFKHPRRRKYIITGVLKVKKIYKDHKSALRFFESNKIEAPTNLLRSEDGKYEQILSKRRDDETKKNLRTAKHPYIIGEWVSQDYIDNNREKLGEEFFKLMNLAAHKWSGKYQFTGIPCKFDWKSLSTRLGIPRNK